MAPETGTAAGLGPADRVVEVGVAGQRPDEPVQPAEHDLAAAQVADPLDPQPERPELRQQGPGRHVDEVARKVEREPAVAEQPGLEAVGVRDRDHQRPARREQPGGVLERGAGVAQVLERVPEDDRGAWLGDLVELGGPHVGAVRVALEPDGRPAPLGERVEQRPVAGADVEHGPGGAIASRRPASRPRSRRSTRSPSPEKRPASGRYHSP